MRQQMIIIIIQRTKYATLNFSTTFIERAKNKATSLWPCFYAFGARGTGLPTPVTGLPALLTRLAPLSVL